MFSDRNGAKTTPFGVFSLSLSLSFFLGGGGGGGGGRGELSTRAITRGFLARGGAGP